MTFAIYGTDFGILLLVIIVIHCCIKNTPAAPCIEIPCVLQWAANRGGEF